MRIEVTSRDEAALVYDSPIPLEASSLAAWTAAAKQLVKPQPPHSDRPSAQGLSHMCT